MKQMKAYFFRIFIASLILANGHLGFGQGKSIQKTFDWNYKVNGNESFTFNNYDCDLIIHTWDKNEIEYEMTVDAKLQSEEEAERLNKYI